MCYQELPLLLCQFIILPARSGTLMGLDQMCVDPADFNPPKLSDLQCRLAAVILHYMYILHFVALFTESIHNYTTYTNVYVKKPFFNHCTLLLTCLVVPILFVAPCAGLYFDTYTHDHTCWLNMDSKNLFFEIGPIAVFGLVTIIISEATGMREFPKHFDQREDWRSSAYMNSKGCKQWYLPVSRTNSAYQNFDSHTSHTKRFVTGV